MNKRILKSIRTKRDNEIVRIVVAHGGCLRMSDYAQDLMQQAVRLVRLRYCFDYLNYRQSRKTTKEYSICA